MVGVFLKVEVHNMRRLEKDDVLGMTDTADT